MRGVEADEMLLYADFLIFILRINNENSHILFPYCVLTLFSKHEHRRRFVGARRLRKIAMKMCEGCDKSEWKIEM